MTPLLANAFHLQRGPLHSENADRGKQKQKTAALPDFAHTIYTIW